MKRFYFIILFVLISCYDDDSQVVESEDTAHRSSELTAMIKSMSLHNTSFDDHIDNTPCFSLVFPYQVNVNSNLTTITSIQDLSELSNSEEIEIVYPVTSVFFNYEEHEISSSSNLDELKNICNQDFNIQPNNCFDFVFPLTVKRFNELNGSFETFHLENDKEVFTHFDNLHDTHVYQLSYPINLISSNSDTLVVNSNEAFKATIDSSPLDCQ